MQEEQRRISISICLGSSCFARGNAVNLQSLRAMLERRGVLDRVDLRGKLCCGECGDGPNLVVNGTAYRAVDEKVLHELISRLIPENSA